MGTMIEFKTKTETETETETKTETMQNRMSEWNYPKFKISKDGQFLKTRFFSLFICFVIRTKRKNDRMKKVVHYR